MATYKVSEKVEISLRITIPDEGNSKKREQRVKDLAAKIQVSIDEFFLSKDQFQVTRCEVSPFTQTVMLL